MTNKGWNTDGWAPNSVESLPRLKIMNCSFKRESQTTEGVDYKQKETPCEQTTQFWERFAEWKCHVFKWQRFVFFMKWMISSRRLPRSCCPSFIWRQNLVVSYQHLLRPNTSLLSFGWEEDGRGCSLPLSEGLPDSHSKYWPSERSPCLSPLGPCEELSSHKY